MFKKKPIEPQIGIKISERRIVDAEILVHEMLELPEVAVGRVDQAKEYYDKLVQLKHEVSLATQLTELWRLIPTLEEQCQVFAKALAASNAGFDLFTPNPDWYLGFMSQPQADQTRARIRLLARAMPQEAIDRYKFAASLRSFDAITVHSPDPDAFEVHSLNMDLQPPRDPILIGWVNAILGVKDGFLTVVERGGVAPTYSFMISAWDLDRDLRAAGIVE